MLWTETVARCPCGRTVRVRGCFCHGGGAWRELELRGWLVYDGERKRMMCPTCRLRARLALRRGERAGHAVQPT